MKQDPQLDELLPALVSLPVAAALLGFPPGPAFGLYRAACPDELPGTPRLVETATIGRHPLRNGKPLTLAEWAAAEKVQEPRRSE